jgi:hypothetical protein
MNQSEVHLKRWKQRLAVGVAAAALMGIVWFLLGIEDETDMRLAWLMAFVAFLVGATEGGQIFTSKHEHDA